MCALTCSYVVCMCHAERLCVYVSSHAQRWLVVRYFFCPFNAADSKTECFEIRPCAHCLSTPGLLSMGGGVTTTLLFVAYMYVCTTPYCKWICMHVCMHYMNVHICIAARRAC